MQLQSVAEVLIPVESNFCYNDKHNVALGSVYCYQCCCYHCSQKKLVPWLRLILRTATLIEFYYQPWSYVIKTGTGQHKRNVFCACMLSCLYFVCCMTCSLKIITWASNLELTCFIGGYGFMQLMPWICYA